MLGELHNSHRSYGDITKYLPEPKYTRDLPNSKYGSYLEKMLGGIDLIKELDNEDFEGAYLTPIVIGSGLNYEDASTLEPEARKLFGSEWVGGDDDSSSDEGDEGSPDIIIPAVPISQLPQLPPLERNKDVILDGTDDKPAKKMDEVEDEILYSCPSIDQAASSILSDEESGIAHSFTSAASESMTGGNTTLIDMALSSTGNQAVDETDDELIQNRRKGGVQNNNDNIAYPEDDEFGGIIIMEMEDLYNNENTTLIEDALD